MRSATRLFVTILPVTAVAAVVLMLAAPAALAGNHPITLVFKVQPTTTQMNTAMTPAVAVEVEDSYGNPVTSHDGQQITLTYAVNNIGAAEPTNNVATVEDGVATFPALTFSDVGFNFELQASLSGQGSSESKVTSSPSQPFDIVTQLVHCQQNQTCQTETVSSQGTSGFAVASQASTSDILTATGGGFPKLSCTTVGGVTSFTFTGGPKTITMMLAKNLVQEVPGPGVSHINICWGQSTPFTTKPGTPLVENNGEFEGLLPNCSSSGPSPCITSRHKTKAGVAVVTISAPPGDPHSSF